MPWWALSGRGPRLPRMETPRVLHRLRRRTTAEPARRCVPMGTLGIGLGGAGAAFVLTGGAMTLGARIMARLPLVPQADTRWALDVQVRAVYPDRVHLDATPETSRPGVIAIRQGGGTIHARLGAVLGRPTRRTVARELLAMDTAEPLTVGPAHSNGFYWAGNPVTAHGLPLTEVEIASPVGPMPAWLVPADPNRARDTAARDTATNDTWAILVHGHGSARGEGLRIIPLLHHLGLTSLTITYRNDTGAPASADSMHHLGSAEWEDAEAAIDYALAAGARRVVLLGWSMGGGIVLRTAVKSAHREKIAALVLDSPAVDWTDILVHHAKALGAPAPMRRLALWMMTSPLGARTVRLREPLALHEMRAEHYAVHLSTPTLLLHAMDDETVPVAPSRRLARLAPHTVRFVGIDGASHTREWNRDAARTERLVAEHLVQHLGLTVDVDALSLPVRDPAAPPLPGATGMRL